MLDHLQKPSVDYRQKILDLARLNPVQPTSVAKALNTNSLLASAMLSELTEKGQLAVSHVKIGSSPLYYLPADAAQLLKYTHVLNDKDQKTMTLLQQEHVLRDTTLDPLERVSLRNLRDFAKPLTVKYGENQELFWKYFLFEDTAAEQLIRQILSPTPPEQPKQQSSTPVQQSIPEKEKTDATHLPLQEKIKRKTIRETLQETPKEKDVIPPQEHTDKTLPSDQFSKLVLGFLKGKSIETITEQIIKKNTEMEIIIHVPTPVGKVVYYCKATHKKRIVEGDISHAFVQGQLKKLPVLFLYTGELTSKAQTLLKELQGVTAAKM